MYEEFVKYLKVYKPNAVIIREGTKEDDFFCLLQGTVGIWKGNAESITELIKVGELKEKGMYFGEMSCLLEEVRSASIIAVDTVKVLKFPGEMLPDMILKQPSLGLKLSTALAARLKGTTTKQQDIAQQRNEIRDDATQQLLYAKEAFQKLFVMLTAVQTQLQFPPLKSLIEFMSRDKLLQGGKKLDIDEEFCKNIPGDVSELVQKAYKTITKK